MNVSKMAVIKKKTLKEMSVEELEKKLEEIKRELRSQVGVRATGGKTPRLRELRKLIARIKTLLSLRGVKT